MQQVVVNRCFGGFGLSDKAMDLYLNRKGLDFIKSNPFLGVSDYTSKDGKESYSSYDMDRSDPDLIAVVKELGEEANSTFSKLEIVEIPDDIEYEISDYDGRETIEEKHRSW